MTILPSNISVEFVKKYLRIEHDLDDMELYIYLETAKSFVESYTSMTIEELDNHKEVIMCILLLCAHFYENKNIDIYRADFRLSDDFRGLLGRECDR